MSSWALKLNYKSTDKICPNVSTLSTTPIMAMGTGTLNVLGQYVLNDHCVSTFVQQARTARVHCAVFTGAVRAS